MCVWWRGGWCEVTTHSMNNVSFKGSNGLSFVK